MRISLPRTCRSRWTAGNVPDPTRIKAFAPRPAPTRCSVRHGDRKRGGAARYARARSRGACRLRKSPDRLSALVVDGDAGSRVHADRQTGRRDRRAASRRLRIPHHSVRAPRFYRPRRARRPRAKDSRRPVLPLGNRRDWPKPRRPPRSRSRPLRARADPDRRLQPEGSRRDYRRARRPSEHRGPPVQSLRASRLASDRLPDRLRAG